MQDQGSISGSMETVVEIKKMLQRNFEEVLSATVDWFCQSYAEAFAQQKFDKKME